MVTCGVDTCTMEGSVALWRDGTITRAETSGGESHSRWLFRAVDRLLRDASLRLLDVEGWAVAIGPGSFTGLRIGIASVKGFAVSFGRPAVGVVSLEAMASAMSVEHPDRRLVPVIDARKGEVYYGVYRAIGPHALECVEGPVAGKPEQAAEAARGGVLAGKGMELCRPFVGSDTELIAIPPMAPEVARIGFRLLSEGRGREPDALQPLYLRASEAELMRAKRERR